MSKIVVYTDGGSRGNPGPAALGVYITDENKNVLAKIGKYIGVTTNNVAEYAAIIEAFDWLINYSRENIFTEVHFFMDSQLACSQLTGVYKVKNDRLREMLFEIRKKEAVLNLPIYYNHVRREFNKQADLMVNIALDKVSKNF